MENLMPNMTECYNSVVSGTGYPRFSITESEAAQLLAACEKAKMGGPLMDKIKTIANYATAKNRYAGRSSMIEMR